MSKIMNIIRYTVIFISIFWGFYFVNNNPEVTMKIVAMGLVGLVGVISFVSHVVFHKETAKRLGWESDVPDWQFEVGFANLAFGLAGLLTIFSFFNMSSRIVIIIAYSIYLLQAAILHGYRAISIKPVNTRKLIFSSYLTFVFVFAMAMLVILSARAW